MESDLYTVLRDADLEALVTGVNDYIGQGWEVFGPPFAAVDGRFCQALVRRAAVTEIVGPEVPQGD